MAVDLCTGLHGWAEGLVSEGWRVRGYDIEDMCAAVGEPRPDHVELVLKSILDLHGAECADADLIVASPPCQEYSYMAMPWTRAKAKAAAIRADETGQALVRLNALFDACFRIQREACEAAGRHIPMVVENVRGAEPWVGRARWAFGSFYLWGDVPALMPQPVRARKNGDVGGGSWFNIGSPGQVSVGGNPDGRKVPGFRFDGSGKSFQTASVVASIDGDVKLGGSWFHGYKPGVQGPRNHGSGSKARKAASARIAKIPLPLSQYIARHYLPQRAAA